MQKSLREGFGLTVTEAMWKGRPVVASAVGGIQDQIRDGVDGLLVRDPTNLEECADAMRRILDDPALAKRLGQAGYERVRDEYLSIAVARALGGALAGARVPEGFEGSRHAQRAFLRHRHEARELGFEVRVPTRERGAIEDDVVHGPAHAPLVGRAIDGVVRAQDVEVTAR